MGDGVTRDQVDVMLIAGAWSVAVGVACAGLSWLLRRSSIRWTAGLIALAAVGGIVAAVLGTARAMFLSSHDMSVVILICVVAGIVSFAFALWLARRIVRSTKTLRDHARDFGVHGVFAPTPEGPRELHAVSDELARSSDRLQAARERQAQLEQSRRDLVAWVSHDLRTPLAGLRAMAEALEDGMVDDPNRYYSQMIAEVDRTARMVDDLFELSRIHAGALNLSLQDVQLSDVVSETIAGAAPLAQAKRVRVSGSVDSDILLQADPAALSRVVANLVMNAIRHTPADGVVQIQASRDGSMVELSVRDACGGIHPADLDRVFDIAWRGDDARTPESSSGGGLGLAIVKGLVEAHRGSVTVANQAPGCRFVVQLPA